MFQDEDLETALRTVIAVLTVWASEIRRDWRWETLGQDPGPPVPEIPREQVLILRSHQGDLKSQPVLQSEWSA